ncbi:hypothetical protein PVAP13_5KG002433 [Panicum virgatum]|uniref:Uncharacterized protein n=1 Tax=Panicum virgatum TaxID=38727 RepID=A0A8T0SD49_PANVG|nr:hypothetical protein PVAP13_5KG002433 [Panicum virgatum]
MVILGCTKSETELIYFLSRIFIFYFFFYWESKSWIDLKII